MSGSAELHHRLRNPYSVSINGTDEYLESLTNTAMVNGAHRECLPGWKATPIGDSPYGFLVCERERDPVTNIPPEAIKKIPDSLSNFVPYSFLEHNSGASYSQSYDLYNNLPTSKPRVSKLGGPALAFENRRVPNQATLQGSDYYRDPIRYRDIGDEKLDLYPGNFGYQENKYYFSAPPPIYDVTQGVQPYEIWRREHLRMGTLTPEELKDFEKVHRYSQYADSF